MPDKAVQLGNGDFFIVDERDYEYVSQFYWNTTNDKNVCRQIHHTDYIEIIILGRELMERMGFQFKDGEECDHIDRDPNNNRRENLRKCTHAQNNTNKDKYKNNTSGYKGVCWIEKRKKWLVTIMKDGVTHHIGYYKDKEEAARAYDHFAKLLHGEFACLNFPEPIKPRCFFDDFLELRS